MSPVARQDATSGPAAAGFTRYAPVPIETPPRGFPLPGLLTAGPIDVVDDGAGYGERIVARLSAIGVDARLALEVSADAAGAIFARGLRATRSYDEAIALQRDALRAARTLAKRQGMRVLVTLQDTGGDFGLSGRAGERAWTGGIAGLAKAAAAEWADAAVKAVDISCAGVTADALADRIVAELMFGGGDVEVGLARNGSRTVIHHRPAPYRSTEDTATAREGARVRPGSVVIVSGGARGVTAAAVTSICKYRPRLVLLGRTALDREPEDTRSAVTDADLRRALLARAKAAGAGTPSPRELAREAKAILDRREIHDTIAALSRAGAEVSYHAVDVRDSAALRSALDGVRSTWGPIRGIVHGAGVLADAPLAAQTDEQFDHVFETKVGGLRHLLSATAEDPLELLITFSSVAGRFGNAAQAAYGMANEVISCVAAGERARRSSRCLVRSLAWGPWAGGMVSPGLARLFEKAGVHLLALDAGTAAFAREVESEDAWAQVILMNGTPPETARPLNQLGHAPAQSRGGAPLSRDSAAPTGHSASSRGLALHPMAAHHDRVSTTHEHFLGTQDSVHRDFLAHRQRLLDGLGRALGRIATPRGAERSAASAPPWEPTARTIEVPPRVWQPAARTVDDVPPRVKLATEVGWDNPFLDAQVMPAGALFAPLGRVAGLLPGVASTGFGILACDVTYLGALPHTGETVLTEIRAVRWPAQTDVRFHVEWRALGRDAAGGSSNASPQGGAAGGSSNASPQGGAAGGSSNGSPPGEPARPLVSIEAHYTSRAGSAPAASDPPPHAGPSASAERMTADGAPAPARRRWTRKTVFSDRDMDALVRGDAFTCFGAGFERAASHTRTPPLPGARIIHLTGVDALDPSGGPWSMGSLRAQVAHEPDGAPFAEDPWLRLGRVYQGALQTLAFFLAASGATLERDGWRFEPSVNHASRLRFTGAPGPEVPLRYELAVERFDGGAFATIDGDANATFAAVVGEVKGWVGDTLVFHGERLSLRLVVDWPLTSDRALLAEAAADDASAQPALMIDGFRVAYRSLLAGALGRPSDAFREPGTIFETGERHMPRLPGPPYHFITRVTAAEGERLTMRPGSAATMEYDIPPDAWYFDENGNRTMPFCVLLEAALQPCGWLSVYVGCPLAAGEDVFFRNLDGSAMTMTAEVLPDSGTLRTHARVVSVTRVSGVMLLSYKIECFVANRQVCHLNATFGYFPKKTLAQQAGLPTSEEQRAQLTAESPVRIDFARRPERYFGGALRLPGPMLVMIDRVTGYFPSAGATGMGRLRAEKDIDPRDWCFKAHFCNDPVQPGSLGLEMMLQLVQFFVIHEDLGKGIERPYFEPLALDCPVTWKFRGQVCPENKRIVTEVEIVSVESRDDAVIVVANGSLWVDGVRCYEAKGIGMRVRGGRQAPALPPRVEESILDPAVDRWVLDHRPSYTVPVMPGMGMVDRLARAALEYVRGAYPAIEGAPAWVVVGADDVRHHGWLICDAPKRLRTDVKLLDTRAASRMQEADADVTLYEITDGGEPRRVSSGRVHLARRFAAPPRAWSPLAGAVSAPSPYEVGAMCWGPRLQLLRRLALGAHGASAELDAAGADAPIGAVHPILLDGALHGIPHDELERWSPKIPPGSMGVPLRLAARFFGPPPRDGMMRAEIRFGGFDGASAFPVFLIQIIDPQGKVWASLRHVEVLVTMSHRKLLKEHRVPFLVQGQFREGVGLAAFSPERSELHAADVERLNALPGSVAHVYGLPRAAAVNPRIIAIKDHVGQRARVHPSRIVVDAAFTEGRCEEQPFVRFPVSLEERDGGDVVVRDAGAATLDMGPLRDAWRRCGLQEAEAAIEVLMARVRGVSVAEPSVMAAARVIFISAPHDRETQLALLLVVSALRKGPVRGLVALPIPGEWGDIMTKNSLTDSFAQQPISAALDHAGSLLEQGTSVVISVGDGPAWRIADIAGPIAGLATRHAAVVVPVDVRHAGADIAFEIGRPTLPEDLRTRTRL